MRTKHEHSVSLSEEVERNIDFLYHSTADHVNKIAKQAGDPNLESVITSRLVRLLEAKTLWESFRHSQSLPQMRPERNPNGRGRRAGSSAWFGQEADLSGGSSGTRTLSAKARRAISKAQHARWAKFHAEKAKQKRKGWSAERRTKYSKRLKKMYADPVLGKDLRQRMNKMGHASGKSRTKQAKAMSNYWARMTPAQRSAEAIRRQQVAAAKKAAA